MALTSANRFTGYGIPSSGVVDISLTRAAGEGIVVCVMSYYEWGAASDISSVVWDPAGDNQTLSLIASRTHSVSARKTGLYYLAAPTSAKTSVLRVTLASTSDEAWRKVFAAGHRVSGHDTASMIRYNADREETDQGLNDFPVTVTSQTGDLVLGFLAVRDYLINVDAGDSSNYAEVDNGAGGVLMMATGSKAGASSVTVTFGFTGEGNFDNSLYAVSVAPGSASATITLTDPVAVVTGSTAACTITRSTAASGNITYNLTSSATGVATVPATATILDGQTTGSFNITGVSAGSSTITATNSADSGETDTATANVSALKGLSVTFGQTGLTGLTFAWFDQASPDLFAAPTVVGTTESTDGSGVLEINLTGTSVAVGNTGFLLIYKAGATAPDDIAFFGRLTVQDIG